MNAVVQSAALLLLMALVGLAVAILREVRRLADYSEPAQPTLAHEADPRLAVLDELRRTMVRRGEA